MLKELEEFAFRGIPDIREYENGLDLTQIIVSSIFITLNWYAAQWQNLNFYVVK